MVWLAAKGHISHEHRRVAQEALAQEGWGFEALPTIKLEGRGGWKAMGIPPGVVRELLKKQKAWCDVAKHVIIEKEMRRQQGDKTLSVAEVSN